MAFNLAFDVIKFSESITPPGPVQIDWTHILGANLQVVLEGSDDDFVLLRMDVVQGTTFLVGVGSTRGQQHHLTLPTGAFERRRVH